ncbi:MAG TPA: hypothetical protein VM824_09145 [Thermoleophilaceae bacterium]|nr:hypothetical protein [Thermoleophilaceae bacterium]
MRRTAPLLLAVLALALPSAALAQSAGDDQYADPFGQVNDGSGQLGGDQPTQSAPAPAQDTTSAAPADQAAASQETAAPALPRTGPGLPAWYIAINGAVLLLAGTALRRGFS